GAAGGGPAGGGAGAAAAQVGDAAEGVAHGQPAAGLATHHAGGAGAARLGRRPLAGRLPRAAPDDGGGVMELSLPVIQPGTLSPEEIARLQEEIRALARARGAVVIAHNYQRPEVQDVADFVGDSLGLSRQAASTDAELIVFCGVHFMAETAAILSPSKRVLLPDLEAGCSLAATVRSEEHTSELQSRENLVCCLLLEKKRDIEVADLSYHSFV